MYRLRLEDTDGEAAEAWPPEEGPKMTQPKHPKTRGRSYRWTLSRRRAAKRQFVAARRAVKQVEFIEMAELAELERLLSAGPLQ
jgi:hypothetical protein